MTEPESHTTATNCSRAGHRRRNILVAVLLLLAFATWCKYGTRPSGVDRAEELGWSCVVRPRMTKVGELLGRLGVLRISIPANPLLVQIDVIGLEIDAAGQTAAGNLKHLREFPRVQHLKIRGASMTDEEMSFVSSVAVLHELVLEETAVTFDGLSKLQTHPSLSRLILCGSSFDDDGLDAFIPPRSLASLELYAVRVSDEAVRRFQRTHPEIDVTNSPEFPPDGFHARVFRKDIDTPQR